MAKIVTIDGIPVYQALVDAEDTGMLRISLVDDPAVQSDFLAFNKKEARKVLSYAVQDEEKRLVLGVVMRADFPIYRRDADGFEYYVLYKAETIRTMAEKYLAENRQNLVNTMHEEGSDVDGVQMVEYFIKDSAKGVAPEGFDGIADGSLFACFHVTNDEVWKAIKDGTYKGFSLEGIFDLAPEHDAEDVQRIVDTLEGRFRTILKQNNMAKLKGLLARLAKAIVNLGNITTDKGVLSWDGEDELKVGDAVYIVDAEGNRTPAEDGEYTAENVKYIVVDGKVAEIGEAGAEPEPAPAEPAEPEAKASRFVLTDKGNLEWDGEDEDLKEGDAVYITDEEGNRNPAPDGDYTTEDGKVISVVDGKVASITDPKAEVSEEAKAETASAFQRIAQAFQETYNDKMAALAKAIEAMGFPWPWLIEAGDEFVVASIYTDNGDEVFYRFKILEWGEDGVPVLENGVKVVPAFVTPEEKEAADEAFRSMQADFEKVKAELVALKAAPAGKPAHEEFKEGGEGVSKTGNKGLDRIASIMSAQ